MHCTHCGTELASGQRFCRGCGRPHEQAPVVAQTAEPAPLLPPRPSADRARSAAAPAAPAGWAAPPAQPTAPRPPLRWKLPAVVAVLAVAAGPAAAVGLRAWQAAHPPEPERAQLPPQLAAAQVPEVPWEVGGSAAGDSSEPAGAPRDRKSVV